MFSSNATQVSAVTQAEAVDYDGTNDYLSRSTDLTGNTDTSQMTFSAWLYWDGSSFGTAQNILGLGRFRIFGWNTTPSFITIEAQDSSAIDILSARVEGNNVLTGLQKGWVSFIISFNLGSTSLRSCYINDTLVSVSWLTYTSGSIDTFITGYPIAIARDNGQYGGVQFYKGRLANVFLDYTYRDLSNVTNRRLFVTADLKPAAGQAALNPILYLPMSNPTTVATNAGTGGNFTLNGTIARSGRGPNQYNAPYSDLNGSTQYLSRTTAPTGIADGKQLTFVCSFNPDTVSATKNLMWFATTTTDRVAFQITSSAGLNFIAQNASGTVLQVTLPSGTFVVGRNYLIAVSVDLSDTSKRWVYLNGQAQSPTWAVYINDNINFNITTSPKYYIGQRNNTGYWDGDLGALWFNTSYIDLSVASNLAKFVSGTGIDAKPVDLGATGELPTGTAPLIYLPMYGNNAGKNYGTGGDFTVNSGPYTGARGPNEFWSGAGLFNNPTQTELSALTLNNSPDVTGITKTTFAVCFKRRDVDVTDNSVIFNTTSSTNNNFHFSVYFDSSEQLVIGWNGHSVATSSTITDTNWHTLLVSVDSTATVARVYLDNVSLTSTITLNRTYTQAYTYVGRATGVSADQCFDGNIGFVYQAHDYIDISQEANRLKFFDAFGYPVDLSAQVTAGAIPAPYIYLLFPESNLGTNNGTAGNFTNNSVTASALVKA